MTSCRERQRTSQDSSKVDDERGHQEASFYPSSHLKVSCLCPTEICPLSARPLVAGRSGDFELS